VSITIEAKTMANKQWRKNQAKDPYFQKAKADGYRARSAYKLLEMNEKFRLIRPGDSVLDVGAAPGSWSQVAHGIVGAKGQVVALDIQPIQALPGVVTIQGDVRDPAIFAQVQALAEHRYHVVISDIAPNATGIPFADHARSIELSLFALVTALRLLKPGGHFVTKVFWGEEFNLLVTLTKKYFRTVRIYNPDATRKESKEAFIVANTLQARADLDPNLGLAALLDIAPTPLSAHN
jgi:23S rRNA (uridine2552-2'-O)-methyltransferase